MKQILHSIILCMSFGMLLSCSSSALHEAQQTVSQADSLWSAGQSCDDSLALAQAYKTLGYWQWFYPDNYVHACYHYGRLLRRKDDPAAAMQAFINATHTRSHDYHLLGRVYSNMGSICHLANEFALSYDMYDRSAGYFLKNGDTLLYYYGLNNMAFELAVQGRKEETFAYLKAIEKHYSDNYIYAKVLETKAVVCLYAQQYDSAVYYAKLLFLQDNYEPTGLIVSAQAYSFLGEKDSAVYYAQRVLDVSQDLFHRNNALYILTNDDETKNKEEIREIAADRADAQKLLEIRQGKMSQAVQLLQQDLAHKPDLTWLIAIFVTIIVITGIIGTYVKHKHRKHALLAQKIEHLEVKYTELQANKKGQLEQTCSTLRASENLQNDLCWKDFDKMCNFVNEHFYLLANKLFQKNVLNETEIRLCVLVLIGLNRAEIAKTLPYALNSIGKLKDHTAKSLGTTGKNLREFLLLLAIEG